MAVSAATVAAARDALGTCRLCPRDCSVDRTASSAGAFCRLDDRAWVYKELLSLGEEPAISPTWLIDIGGCSLRCLFCSEWQHVVRPLDHGAEVLDPAWFARAHARRVGQGAKTISFAGGDPTPSLPAIVAALHGVAEPLPVVWNCNAAVGEIALHLLADVVSVWSLDAKFGNAACAERLAGVRGFDLQAELRRTFGQAGKTAPAGGLPTLIVRHLLMPGHFACCTQPMLHLIADALPAAHAVVNLMTMFVPPDDARLVRHRPELQRWNRPDAVDTAVRYAQMLLGDRLIVDGR